MILRPSLPESIQKIEMRNLRVKDAVVKPRFKRHDYSISVNIEERLGHVKIVSIKEKWPWRDFYLLSKLIRLKSAHNYVS